MRLRRHLSYPRGPHRIIRDRDNPIRGYAFLLNDHSKSTILHGDRWHLSWRVCQLHGGSGRESHSQSGTTTTSRQKDPWRDHQSVEEVYTQVLLTQSKCFLGGEWVLPADFWKYEGLDCQGQPSTVFPGKVHNPFPWPRAWIQSGWQVDCSYRLLNFLWAPWRGLECHEARRSELWHLLHLQGQCPSLLERKWRDAVLSWRRKLLWWHKFHFLDQKLVQVNAN